ncbi:MAG TPA: hypothetical protein VNM67_18260 [Thermoanaerobaculia bacterium]|jgi:hypothetical protein|nr:hypothetical protein [Thermoanaerobaculia bacterium]
MARLYLETSVVSYLTARPATDIITAAHQLLTFRWWSLRRAEFEILTSELLPHVTDLVEEAGFNMPFVCTPEELLGFNP